MFSNFLTVAELLKQVFTNSKPNIWSETAEQSVILKEKLTSALELWLNPIKSVYRQHLFHVLLSDLKLCS